MFTNDAVIILRYIPDPIKVNDFYALEFYYHD